MKRCPSCKNPVQENWEKCPCGFILKEKDIFYPEHIVEEGKLDHLFKGQKEYMLCTVCKKPIKEEESYYDKNMKVFLHLACHPKFMRMVKDGEVK